MKIINSLFLLIPVTYFFQLFYKECPKLKLFFVMLIDNMHCYGELNPCANHWYWQKRLSYNCLVTINIQCKSWMGTWIQMSWWSVQLTAFLSLFWQYFSEGCILNNYLCLRFLAFEHLSMSFVSALVWININVLWEQSLTYLIREGN